MARSTIPLQSGAKLGPYKIEACIGAGGMGEVFRAVDTRLRRTVAVKLLPLSRSADPSHRQRFLREARSASALSHANIVSVYDLCSHDGYDFIVMEYVDGRTLKDMIGISSLPLHEIVDLGAQIASALQAAHSAGIVHRDIKPANIMVTPNHQVKVLDFGIAKSVSAMAAGDDLEAETATLARVTEAGALIGTLAYMSPEQTRGEPVDRRSDIFSFGSLLYEASTGRLPFAGPSAFAVMQQIATATPPAPSSLRTELPVALDRLLAKCLEKAPERRPAQASEIGEALKSLTLAATAAKAISAPAHDSRRTVAVVPLQFLAATQEDEFLSVALADAIANRLGSASTLIVRPTSSLLKYAGKKTDWTEIARELNVDLVVEGSIQKMGARVRVMVQACACHDSGTLHSAKIDGDANDLFDLQDRLADSVFNALTPHARDKTARHAPAPPRDIRWRLSFICAPSIMRCASVSSSSPQRWKCWSALSISIPISPTPGACLRTFVIKWERTWTKTPKGFNRPSAPSPELWSSIR
jgi:TolB-like protein/predicted Ser/Thr protein kinase